MHCGAYKGAVCSYAITVARWTDFNNSFAVTLWAIKKRATFIFTITLANVDRFQ